jgi:hypothetical protein
VTSDRQPPSNSFTALPARTLAESPDSASSEAASASPGGPEARRPQLWVRRISVLLFVVLCAVVGVLLVVLPWSLQWTSNRFLWGYPDLREALNSGFVRGICSGLGMLNLWIGFREAVHYHESAGASK